MPLLALGKCSRECMQPVLEHRLPSVCAVPVPCTHSSACVIPEFLINVTSADHTCWQNLRKTMMHAECERAYCGKMSGRGWAGGLDGSLLCTLQVKPQEDTFHNNTWNFSSRGGGSSLNLLASAHSEEPVNICCPL